MPMSFLIFSVGWMAAVVRAPVTEAPNWLGATFSECCCTESRPVMMVEFLATVETRPLRLACICIFARSEAGPRIIAADDSLPSSTLSPAASPGRAASGEACGKLGKLGSSYST